MCNGDMHFRVTRFCFFFLDFFLALVSLFINCFSFFLFSVFFTFFPACPKRAYRYCTVLSFSFGFILQLFSVSHPSSLSSIGIIVSLLTSWCCSFSPCFYQSVFVFLFFSSSVIVRQALSRILTATKQSITSNKYLIFTPTYSSIGFFFVLHIMTQRSFHQYNMYGDRGPGAPGWQY